MPWDRHLQGESPLSWQRATDIALQVARALQHAQDNGVVHRDIKPQNILLTEDGTVKVSDFGIARALASSTRSRTSSVMGTPQYMAPEQWASGSLDGRLDQYALGIVFYEMLAGATPFQGDSMENLFVQHRDSPMPALPGGLGVPDAVERVIRRATEKTADARFRSADDMAGALEGALGRTPSAEAPTPPSIPPRPPPVGAGAGGGRIGGIPSWLFFGGLGAVVTAAIILAAAMVLGGNGGDPVQIAVPPPTDEPTLTPIPTSTIVPPTATPVPTATPRPTYTPYPTPIPTPRPTPTPNASSYYDKGNDYIDEEKYQLAIDEFTTAILLNPNYTNAYNNRGFAYDGLGQHQRAIENYDKAIQLDPDYADTYYNRGAAYDELGQDQRAIQDYDKAIQLEPNNDRAYHNRGMAYHKLSQYQRALEDYDKAIQLDPDVVSYVARGNAYYRLGQYQRAIQDYSKGIQLDPDDALAYNNRGWVYRRLG